jgi:hypothetical protein
MLEVSAPYVYRIAIAGSIFCAFLFVVFWFWAVVWMFPIWKQALSLTMQQRGQLQSYFFAPLSSYDDPWIDTKVRELFFYFAPAKRHIMRCFSAGIGAFLFAVLGAIFQNLK